MKDKINIGIIGTGGISGCHLAAYAKNPNVNIYAMCDINPEHLKNRADQYGVTRRYNDCREMLKLPELDAVSVTTWNAAHKQCVIEALNAGKHVLCEKPMAMNAAEAEEMQQAAVRNHRILMIGFVRRYGHDTDVIMDFIKNGYFGEIYYAKTNYTRRNGCPGGWFGNKAISGGGPLIDLGVHVIDLTKYLMGNHRPVSVYGATFTKLGKRPNLKSGAGVYMLPDAKQEDPYNVEDLATAMIRFDNGALLSAETSFSLNIEKDNWFIELYGTKAGCRLDDKLTLFTELNDYMVDVNFYGDVGKAGDIFQNEIDHFVACVREGKPCRSPGEDGVAMMKILDSVYKSAASGHEIIIPEESL